MDKQAVFSLAKRAVDVVSTTQLSLLPCNKLPLIDAVRHNPPLGVVFIRRITGTMSDTLCDIESMEFQKDLDARGLNCPLPILKAKKALAEMQTGEVLRIVATDSGSVRDFQAFAKQTGNALLSHTQQNGEFTFLMRRK
jgi:tRNA 2-thiouridine synthesizing protein A